jgi:hypothetical protein
MPVGIGMEFEGAAVRVATQPAARIILVQSPDFPQRPAKTISGSRDATYFFTSGQVDCDKGWKASSAGMVATSL